MPRPVAPGISIIVPASTTARDTLLRVRSLLRYSPPDRQIIIVDNALPAEQLRRVEQFAASQPSIRLYHYNDQPDLATMYNRAARKAERSAVLFVLDDLRIDKSATHILERMMERALQPGTGAVGCMIVDRFMNILHAGIFRHPDEPFGAVYGGHRLSTIIRKLGSRTYPYDPRKSRPVLAVVGALMMSRDTFRASGGFREQTRLHPAALQVELCLRTNQAGKQTWFVGGGHIVGNVPSRNLQPSPDVLKELGDIEDPWSPEAPAPRKARQPIFRLPWLR